MTHLRDDLSQSALGVAALGLTRLPRRPLCDASQDPEQGHRNRGLLRQYFPRGTDLSRFSQDYLNRIAQRLNQRPRKTLGFETPADRLQAVLQ